MANKFRLRYKPTNVPGVFIATNIIYSEKYNKHYEVIIDLNELCYKIYDPLSGRTTYTSFEPFSDAGALKRSLRKKLVQLGLKLRVEIRGI